mmetsp:Transcript_32592/g.28604  ORF Transcript_32592/g.28604 Transcript_32592/m.28604 type:complete len:146 (+) Transcript_32592:34-471(+)
METSQSCRGHPGYKNYKPYEIVVKQRIAKWGFLRARIGRPQLASWIIPICAVQIVCSWYSQIVYRRNRRFMMDEHREVHNRLHPLYKHEELKYRYLEDEELRMNTNRAAMELGDEFDFDELKIYHYPERHPDMTITAQAGILGPK